MARKGWKERREAEERARAERPGPVITIAPHDPADDVMTANGLTVGQMKVVKFFLLLASIDDPRKRAEKPTETESERQR